jgi:hypothetical protein
MRIIVFLILVYLLLAALGVGLFMVCFCMAWWLIRHTISPGRRGHGRRR